MEPDHRTVQTPIEGGGKRDDSVPTLLFVSLAALFAAVLGVVAISQVSTTSVLLLALIVMLLGVVALGALIARQLADYDGRTTPRDAPAASVRDGPERSPGRRDDDGAARGMTLLGRRAADALRQLPIEEKPPTSAPYAVWAIRVAIGVPRP